MNARGDSKDCIACLARPGRAVFHFSSNRIELNGIHYRANGNEPLNEYWAGNIMPRKKNRLKLLTEL